LKIDTKELEDRQIELTVEVPDDQLQRALRAAARRMSKETKISGFRPGKAPYEVILSKFGEETVFEEALDELGQEMYRTSLEETELEPYAPGIFNDIVSREPLTLRFTVPLIPEIDLGDYRSLRIPYEEPVVSDEALEEAMEDLRQRQALIEPVERAAAQGDVVILDARGALADPAEGEDARLLDTKGVSVLVEEDSDFPVAGVYEHLLGMEPGVEISFEHTFQDEYPAEDLRGRTSRFDLTCLEVKSRLVPDWSDDLAQNMGEFESLLDLRVKVRESLQAQAEHNATQTHSEQVMQALVEQATVSFPPAALEEELERLLRELSLRLQGQNLTLQDYLKVEGKTLEDLRTELTPDARERVTRGLILGEVVELEGLDVEETEIDAEIEHLMEPLGREGSPELRKAFDSPAGRRRIAIDLLTDKGIKRLLAIARGDTIPEKETVAEPSGEDAVEQTITDETEAAELVNTEDAVEDLKETE